MSTTLILGRLRNLKIGYVTQSWLVIMLLLKATCSNRASLMPTTVPPSVMRFIWSGLMTMPGSSTTVYLSTLIFPVFGLTVMSAAAAQ
jgi:hypothetical protein